MLNIVAKKSVLVFSVVLLNAPFSASVHAQKNTVSSQILFEMQAMRAEIADLRDMVERQQYELKKLNRRNAELESLQEDLQADVKAQIIQLQQSSRLVQANSDYNSSFEAALDQQADAPVSMESKSLPNTSLGGSSNGSTQVYPALKSAVEAQSPIDGREQHQRVVTNAQKDIIDNSDGAKTKIDKYTPHAVDQGQMETTQGPEIVERGFNSADLNRPVSRVSLAIEENGSSQGDVITAERNTAVAAVTPTKVDEDGINMVNPVLNTQSNSDNNASSPILSVPNLESKFEASSTQVNPEKSTQTSTEIARSKTPVSDGNQVVSSLKPDQLTEDQYYDQGFEYLKQSKYDEAISTFNQQIALYPRGDLADDAHYWIAEAYFINRKSAEAKPYLKSIIDNHPTSPRLPDVMLKTAYIEQDMGNVIEARILLQEIVAKYPSSNAAIAARNRLVNL